MRATGSCRTSRLTVAKCLLWMLVLAHLFVGTVGAASLSHVSFEDVTHTHVSGDHGHGHAHAADEPEQAGAHHAHDATDHSHDKPNVPPPQLSRALAYASTLNASERRRDYPSPCSLPERPPKQLPMS